VYLFSQPGIPAQRAICFADVFSLFFFIFLTIFNGRPQSKSISGTTEWIFTKISGLGKSCVR